MTRQAESDKVHGMPYNQLPKPAMISAKIEFSCLQSLSWIIFWFLLALSCPGPSGAAGPLSYSLSFQGIEDKNLLEDLKKSSNLLTQKNRPPLSAFFLKKQSENDLQRLLETCFAHGYYQAEAEVRMDTGPEGQLEVVYAFNPGPIYRIQDSRIKVVPRQQKKEIVLPGPEDLNIPRGTPARADSIRNAKAALQRQLLAQGYPDLEQEKPEVFVDDAAHSVSLIFHVLPGNRARLGQTTIHGLERTAEAYVREKIPWSPGQLYDPALIYQFKSQLMNTGLFNLVKVDLADQTDAQARRPVTVTIRERAPRSVRLGLGYETDIGPQARAAWSHRNFLNQGEKLSFSSNISSIKQELTGTLSLPDFYHPDQSLLISSSLLQEDYDSYENRAFKTEIGLQRRLSPDLSLNSGIGYKAQDTDDAQGTEQFHLLFFPGHLEWDTRDDLLDPSQGANLGLGFIPYQSLFPSDLTYFKSLLTARWYQALNKDKTFILALRSKLGSITGAATKNIPADERFYAGGGGSIRGYPYQEVGPQKDGDPFGGRSLIEVSSELRWKIADPFGAALFLDGGQVSDDSLPNPGEDLAWGAGLGLRYYTELGPLRLDVGFPLNPDDHIDNSFQVYISIGQAF